MLEFAKVLNILEEMALKRLIMYFFDKFCILPLSKNNTNMPLADKELNNLVLRPRFNFKIKYTKETVLLAFEQMKTQQNQFVVNRVDEHIFIKCPKENQSYTSPQLHLEIDEIDTETCEIFGVFGPSPTAWTLFMFFHFVLAVLFIGFAIAAYTKWSLNKPFDLYIVFMVLPIFGWIILYFIGKHRKEQSIPQMLEQHHFMRDVLRGLRK